MDEQELDPEELLKDLPNQTWDFGTKQGVESKVHFEDGKVVIDRKFDAEPLADYCHAERILTAGESWGDGRKVGTIPAPIFAQMCRDGTAFDTKAVLDFFRRNPHFATFDKVLK